MAAKKKAARKSAARKTAAPKVPKPGKADAQPHEPNPAERYTR